MLRGLATETPGVDLDEWKALQQWLQHCDTKVVIPYVRELAELIPPVAVRLRRDFTTLQNLIKAHAILHQASRESDGSGGIVATLEDYAIVKELVSDLMSEGVGATVDLTVRETVNAVEDLRGAHNDDVTTKAVGEQLGIGKSAAHRRSKKAISLGYLQNLEERKGKPAKLALGEAMPEDLIILPEPEMLAANLDQSGCAVAVVSEGSDTPRILPDALRRIVV